MKIIGQLLLFSCFVVSLLPACGVAGDRAAGGCPADEICSPATPNGLVFEGAPATSTLFSGSSISPVAIGGTQRISIRTHGGEPLPLFDAVSSDGAVAVDGISGDEITIRGVEAGTALLRVLDPADGGSLLDRTTVEAAPVDRAHVVPTEDLAIMLSPSPRDVSFAPGEHVVAVQLLDPSSRAVIDQGMRISAGSTPAAVEDWDSVRLTVPAEGGVSLSVEAAGATFAARVESAGAIDDLELVDWLLELDASDRPLLSGGDQVCAIALSGGAWVVGSGSAGDVATTSFVLGGVELAGEQSVAATHCATIPATPALGPASLEVTIAGVSRSFDVEIVDRPASTTAPLTAAHGSLRRGGRALGERAAR